jgi:hypothetical protein
LRRGVPVGPLVATAVAVAAINVALASGLARLVARGSATTVDPAIVGVLLAIGVAAGIYAVAGWRRYLRRRA